MRICYLVDAKNIHGRRWIAPFIDLGYEVYVISYIKGSEPLIGAAANINLTTKFNIRTLKPFIWGIWLNRYLRKIKPDLFHVHQMPATGLIATIANYHPLIVTAWGSDLLATPRKSKFWNLLTKFNLKFVDNLSVPSPAMAEAALNLDYPVNKLHIIPWGIDTDTFKYVPRVKYKNREIFGLPMEKAIILCPKAFRKIQNIDTLIHAFNRIHKKYPQSHLVLIQYNVDNDYRDSIVQMIDSLNLISSVTLLSKIKSIQLMADLYRSADIVISIPSSEGYGRTVYEALACGVPTIISNLPVFNFVLDDEKHVLKVPVGDVDVLASAILRALINDSFRSNMISNALKIVEELSFQTGIEKTNELYIRVGSVKHLTRIENAEN